jgi:trehalose 6-phosphate synthase/phosphatase
MRELIIISNRLPVSVRKTDKGVEVYPSSGGLATGLSGYTKRPGTKWIGWPGLPSDGLTDAERDQVAQKLKRYRCYPVFLTQKQIEAYYNGYSNSVLWPLCHDLPVHSGDTERNWQAYQAVNRLFASTALELSKPGSTLWVHDYQLFLVPQMLRTERPSDHIGFFSHIPFPAAEIFTANKHAASILSGVLGADLAGFHTTSYSKNFLKSCQQLGLGDVTGDQIVLPGRVVRAAEFPMGIDYFKFANAARQHEVQVERRKLERRYRGQKLIVTVDRLEPAKGLTERLEAYEQLLARNRNLRGAVTMLMLVIPSREGVAEYQQLKMRVEELVDRINDEFSTERWQPVDYMYQTVPFEILSAMYQRADVAFIAPLRDGMNLVAKEYLASQGRRGGVLVLSKTAGAAAELTKAIQVDPAKPGTLVSGLKRALTLPKTELQTRTSTMRRHLRRFTVQRWADSFMGELYQPQGGTLHRTPTLDSTRQQKLIGAYRGARHRLLLFDYDGVLHPFERIPAAAKPSRELRALLKRLGNMPSNDVVIVSGRDKTELSTWFKSLPVALAAEHGALFRRKGGRNWHKTSSSDLRWRHPISVILEHYSEQTPGALVEQKEWSIAWHYRTATPYQAQKHLVAIRRLLKPLAKEYGLQILESNKALEVRPADVSKGRVAQEWLTQDYDFVLAMGSGAADEHMLETIQPGGYTIRIGRGATVARFRLPNVATALDLLNDL